MSGLDGRAVEAALEQMRTSGRPTTAADRRRLDPLMELLRGADDRGPEKAGPSVLQHSLLAANLAVADRAGARLIAAALLHDVGRLILRKESNPRPAPIGNELHSIVAADWLAQWFGPGVTRPIRLQTMAKRFLCTSEPGYLGSLSEESRKSLADQGGLMEAAEQARFLGTEGAEASIRLRRWDDRARIADARVPGLDAYRPLLEALML